MVLASALLVSKVFKTLRSRRRPARVLRAILLLGVDDEPLHVRYATCPHDRRQVVEAERGCLSCCASDFIEADDLRGREPAVRALSFQDFDWIPASWNS